MSLFGGLYSRFGAPLHEASIDGLERALARSGDAVDVYRHDRLALAKVNIGVFDDLGIVRDDHSVFALAGHPLLQATLEHRATDAAVLKRQLDSAELDRLAGCRGQFALAHGSPGRLVLATDFVGIRPLFYHVGCDHVFFATALHAMEAMPGVPRRVDPLGVMEEISFGHPLADRTMYADIKCLRPGEALVVENGVPRSQFYARLDGVGESSEALNVLLDRLYAAFLEANRLRSTQTQETLAFLSGGLDSRCTVGALVAGGRRVRCVNIRRPGRPDTTLAAQFADALGVPLVFQDPPAGEGQQVSKGRALGRLGQHCPRRAAIFTGDGGSVGMGHVYMNDHHVRLMRSGDIDAVSAYSLSMRGRPSRLAFPRKSREQIFSSLQRGIREELARLDGAAEAGRKYHIFLIQNDQHRHLHHHFENLDAYRAELLTPFFDTEFLKNILAIPLDPCMRHRAYYRWLERFPAAVREIPWQAYPGHLPCPVTVRDTGSPERTQWKPTRRERWRASRPEFRRSLRDIWTTRLPREVGIPRRRVLLALVLHALRIRNGRGMFRAFNRFVDAYRRCVQ